MAEDAAVARPQSKFTLDFTADAWFPRLVGDVHSAGGANRNVKDLDFSDSEFAPSLQGRASWDRWFVYANGFSFDTESNYTVTNSADSFAASFDWWSVSAELGYALYTPFADQVVPWGEASFDRYGGNVNSNGDYITDLRLSPTLGVSYNDLELNDRNVTQMTARDAQGGWIAPMFGGELQLWLRPGSDFAFLKAIVIEASMSGGPLFGISGDADSSGFVYSIEAGARFMVHDNVGVHIGYRLMDGEFDTSDGRDDLAVSLQGLLIGVAIRF